MRPTPPTQPPTADELLAHPVIQQALEQAWDDSCSDDPARRHEEGGWIYLDVSTGELSVQRAPVGLQAEIDLDAPPVLPNRMVVGKFHTHSNPTAEGWNPGPSAGDHWIDAIHGVPDLIRADNGVHFCGPPSRRGGLGGGPGYPP